jgi:hypothetical protein
VLIAGKPPPAERISHGRWSEGADAFVIKDWIRSTLHPVALPGCPCGHAWERHDVETGECEALITNCEIFFQAGGSLVTNVVTKVSSQRKNTKTPQRKPLRGSCLHHAPDRIRTCDL